MANTRTDTKIVDFPGQQFFSEQPNETAQQSSTDESIETEGINDSGTVHGISELPFALARLRSRHITAAILMLIAVIVFVFLTHSWESMIFFLLPAFFVYKAFEIEHAFAKGTICEIRMTCVGTQTSTINRDRFTVTFCTDAEPMEYKQFHVVGKNVVEDFQPGAEYMLYYTNLQPDILMAYAPAGFQSNT